LPAIKTTTTALERGDQPVEVHLVFEFVLELELVTTAVAVAGRLIGWKDAAQIELMRLSIL